MHAHVSREEWVFRGLAIAMCLAMVGMDVMPAIISEQQAAIIVAVYLGKKYADAGATSAGLLLGGTSAMWLGLKMAEFAGAYALGLAAAGVATGVGLAI